MGSLYLLFIGEEVVVPLLYALFASIVLNPMVNFLIRHKVPKLLAISLGILVTILFVSGIMAVISVQLSMVARTYPELRDKLDQTLSANISWCAEKLHTDPASLLGMLKTLSNELTASIQKGMGQALLTTGNALMVIVLIPVYIFLILLYKPLLLEFVRKLFNPIHHETVVDVLGSIKKVIQSYLVGLIIEGLIVAVMNSVALLILGVEYAIILGITGAILNVIPFIGGIIAIALPMTVAFLTKTPITVVWVFASYIVVQFIDNHYLVPYIVASKVKINALVAIVVVLIGNMLWGVPGMFLSIPLTALLKIIFDHIDSLKPWGYILGDDIPLFIKLPFLTDRGKKKKTQ